MFGRTFLGKIPCCTGSNIFYFYGFFTVNRGTRGQSSTKAVLATVVERKGNSPAFTPITALIIKSSFSGE